VPETEKERLIYLYFKKIICLDI